MEKTVDLAGKGRKGGHAAGGARTAATWQSGSLIRRGTGLCAKDTVTHIRMHSHSVVTE